jgi:hypothetical protein
LESACEIMISLHFTALPYVGRGMDGLMETFCGAGERLLHHVRYGGLWRISPPNSSMHVLGDIASIR